MSATAHKQGSPQLKAAVTIPGAGTALIATALISAVVNLLALTAPLFMLQVYDRVLSSRSESTLAGLAILAAALYGFSALLDILRGRILLRVGEQFDAQVADRTFQTILALPLRINVKGDGLQPLRDLDSVRSFLSGQGPSAFLDLPWVPFYLVICFLFHPWLGFTALAGAVILTVLTLLTSLLSNTAVKKATEYGAGRNALTESARRNAEVVKAMGLGARLAGRWQHLNAAYIASNRKSGDVIGGFSGLSRSLRVMLQSAILAVGAWLVIHQEVSPGVMIASSVIMGRALAPVDQTIANWRPFLMARHSWQRLKQLLALLPPVATTTDLPAPKGDLRAEAVAVVPPGASRPTIIGVSFGVAAGSAVGIIGPSGSGKSTLVRALVGAWPAASGKIRLDGAALDQWRPEELGAHIGYLPQDVELFDGTIAENIARFDSDLNAEEIVAAAKAAGAHELIVRFEDGYQTQVGEGGSSLSAGQRQRIGLARALFGNPFLVVLDEPNAHLDAEGEAAVVAAIMAVRRRNGVAIVVAHRPSAFGAVDTILVMEGGQPKMFGPRDDVLSKVLKAHQGARSTATPAASDQRVPQSRQHGALQLIPAAVDGGSDPISGNAREEPLGNDRS